MTKQCHISILIAVRNEREYQKLSSRTMGKSQYKGVEKSYQSLTGGRSSMNDIVQKTLVVG